MKILLHGLNYAPEELGIGKYSGEMIQYLADQGHHCAVVTAPPYYPQWKILPGFSGWQYRKEAEPLSGDALPAGDEASEPVGQITVIRCPIWVPNKVTGLRRILHLASFGLSSIPAVIFQALRQRPDVVITVEPSAFCMPSTWLAARLVGAKAWLHVQDFEVDAAFDLGILKYAWLRRAVLAVERFWMRRFDRVSTISPNMQRRLVDKGVQKAHSRFFPNWVDCDQMRPLASRMVQPERSTQRSIVTEGYDDNVNVMEKVPDPDGAKHPEGRSGHRGQTSFPNTEVVRIDRQHLSDSISELRDQFGIPANAVIAMYAGSIGAKQGLEIVIEAAQKLLARSSAVHLVICGDGAAYQEIAKLAQSLPNVQLLPVQPIESLNDLLNCADLHLLPQRADAADLVMPSKLTGMLATGRPVVAIAAPGTQIAEVVEGAGLVVAPGDVEAFAGAIQLLADDPEHRTRLGAAARQYAVENLGRTAILSRFEQELGSLTGRPLPARQDAGRERESVSPFSPSRPPVDQPATASQPSR